jgi:uncharacterized protein YdhG (YjbR/CyaY superfamily)
MTDAKATTRNGSGLGSGNVWTDEERAAMQTSARERKAASKRSPAQDRAEGLRALQDSIAKMPADDRRMAERIHAVVTAAVPSLVPKTYYGMPAYAREDGKVIAFFKPKSKFKVRYSTFGFQPDASLDDGDMWPTEFAVINLTSSVEARLVELVVRASG